MSSTTSTTTPGPTQRGRKNYEPFLDAYDAELADDFVVPAGVRGISTASTSRASTAAVQGPATSVNVRVYEDAAGLPGVTVTARLNLAFTGGASFVVTLDPAVRLGPGHFWISVQANEDFVQAGQWGWIDRLVKSGEGAAWQNPGGGFGICPAWGTRSTTCNIDEAAPDPGLPPARDSPVAACVLGWLRSAYRAARRCELSASRGCGFEKQPDDDDRRNSWLAGGSKSRSLNVTPGSRPESAPRAPVKT